MDRLEHLTQRLLEDLDRRGGRPVGPECLRQGLLGRLAMGRLDAHAATQAQTHLDGCLPCHDRFVVVRDDLMALTTPEAVSPRLTRALDELLGVPAPPARAIRLGGSLRRLLVARIPAWPVAAAATAILLTWAATDRSLRPATPVAPSTRADDRQTMAPAHAQLQRTVSGVVQSVRDATSNGVEAHVVDLEDASGASYIVFAWGRPTVQAGETVEIDAIVTTGGPQPAGGSVYQGLAVALRKVR